MPFGLKESRKVQLRFLFELFVQLFDFGSGQQRLIAVVCGKVRTFADVRGLT